MNKESFVRVNASWEMKYALSPFGVRITDDIYFSYMIIVNLLTFTLPPLLVVIFPPVKAWVDSTAGYDNWVTGEPAHNSLTVGLVVIFVILVAGGIINAIAQNRRKRLILVWHEWEELLEVYEMLLDKYPTNSPRVGRMRKELEDFYWENGDLTFF